MINELLNDKQFDIEFNGHLTNHVKHAVIALTGLGVPDERVAWYYQRYVDMTPYGMRLEPPRKAKHRIDENNWRDFLGKRTSFSAYCDFFRQEIATRGRKATLALYVPELIVGWVGSLTHGTIHLGWALSVEHEQMIIEGLAYMAYSYVPCHDERSRPDVRLQEDSVFHSILRLATYCQQWQKEMDAWQASAIDNPPPEIVALIHPELQRSGLQYRIACALHQGHQEVYRQPEWLTEQNTEAIWLQLYQAVTLIYLAAPGHFLLLHLLTSLFAMEQISRHLPAKEERRIQRNYWVGMQCILLATGSLVKPDKLQALLRIHCDEFDDTSDPLWLREWQQLTARSIEEEEEHNPKLVYVMKSLWLRTKNTLYRATAHQFTSTPELPASFDDDPNLD
ncbi:questin oxidase family protein [Pectobacterium aroidearum]|uniref:questin oxidase family protein n=1 Tax=Pectobacterium aroidearum TaxID=1201031 RepID=UPI0015F0E107|nr:questin oxidase family protein [Pectobacterium aroidearum]MBA5234956.1 questin oxidase family protein [Pectobacterium aroidearum]